MIFVFDQKNNQREIPYKEGQSLLCLLQENGYEISANCQGNGKCGKCTVKIIDNGQEKIVQSCKTKAKDNISVFLSVESFFDTQNEKVCQDALDKRIDLALALDVGTTTLAFCFVDLNTGKTIKTYSCFNPERSFGADVISRIDYATKNGISLLNKVIFDKINQVIELAQNEFNTTLNKTVITGNTVMLHILAKKSIDSFGKAPFTPLFLDTLIFDETLGINSKETILLPSFSSFVGADIVCGGIATNILNGENLLIDLGTNGEMLYHKKGELLSCSVAAGPTFEGADIECGVGGIVGAIDRVYLDGDKVKFTTIDGASPVGICGAGLIDAIAVMLEKEIIDQTGAFCNDNDKFYLCDSVYISDKDVRKFQLAKSAVRSGIETLLNNFTDHNIDNLFVCGGLGFYINIDNAVKVGLIPNELKDKICPMGNTALIGATKCLLDYNTIDFASKLSKKAKNIELATNSFFMEKFVENMLFDN